MKGKASDICSKCKHSDGLDMFAKTYSCKHYNNYPDAAIGTDCEIECDNFEAEGKVGELCPKCKNCKGTTKESNGVHVWLTEVECEDPYDGMTKTLDADSNVCCSMFEEKKEKEPFNLNMPREAIKTIAKLNDVIAELKEDNKRLTDSNKALFEENLDRLDKHTKQCQEIDDLKNELKKANELAESWKRDYETCRDQIISPIYNILYPDKVGLDINVTDLLNDVKNLKIYADENGQMYKELQEWREKCISRGNDVDRLLSENKEKDKKISELKSRVNYWSNKTIKRANERWEAEKDRDKWRSLYNSLSETCADYDKRCKEECEKKYRDEISKLQNIVTEKEVEIKGLKKDNVYLSQREFFADLAMKKNEELNQTISDQEVTIKALLITIKEMCKED